MELPFEVDVVEAHRLLQAGALLLDIREPFETDICAVEGSLLLPMRQVPESIGVLPSDRIILVFCHHGVRSARVTQFLRANGLRQAVNVAGGIAAWSSVIDPAIPRY
jgi:rhodanese-related sulfurtransferase